MNLPGLREDLVQVLNAGGLPHVFGHLPERVSPPVVLVEPADPYVTDDADELPFGHVQVGYDLLVVGRTGRAAEQTRQLDDLIQQVIDAVDVDGSQWAPADVARPFTLTVGSATYLTTRITVTTMTRL